MSSPNPNFASYYSTIDFEIWLRQVSAKMVTWLKKNVQPLDLAQKLAEDHAVLLLKRRRFRCAVRGSRAVASPIGRKRESGAKKLGNWVEQAESRGPLDLSPAAGHLPGIA